MEVRDQPGDLDEGPATGVGEASMLSSSGVWLAWGSSDDYIDALREPLEYSRAEAVGIEWESPVPVLVG